MMIDNEGIRIKIARTLRVMLYSALLLLLFSLVFRHLNGGLSRYLALCGIGLVLIGPLTGVFAVGILALIGRKNKMIIYSLLLLIIYITAYYMSV